MADFRSAPDATPLRALKRQALSGASCFDAVLAARPCARSPHFYVHHLPVPAPSTLPTVARSSAHDSLDAAELSTGDTLVIHHPVDERCWRLGMIVPKRHAKRSVTRSLVKRRIRAQWTARLDRLPPGDWVVRLMTPLDRKAWPSAASDGLAALVSTELAMLIEAAAERARQGPQPMRTLREGGSRKGGKSLVSKAGRQPTAKAAPASAAVDPTVVESATARDSAHG